MLINHFCPNPDCELMFKAENDEIEVFCPECGEEVGWMDYDPEDHRNSN